MKPKQKHAENKILRKSTIQQLQSFIQKFEMFLQIRIKMQ